MSVRVVDRRGIFQIVVHTAPPCGALFVLVVDILPRCKIPIFDHAHQLLSILGEFWQAHDRRQDMGETSDAHGGCYSRVLANVACDALALSCVLRRATSAGGVRVLMGA